MKKLGILSVWTAVAMAGAAAHGAEEPLPRVRPERPRIFLRAESWQGPSLEKIREWMKRPEYQMRARKLARTDQPSASIRLAELWLFARDEAAGRQAVARFKKSGISGNTPSYWGISAQQHAALYDWLHDHPDMDEASRKERAAHLERWGDTALSYLRQSPATPFYSRQSGALSALTTIGLALHGDSPKAEAYLRFAADCLRHGLGTIRQMEDGASGDGTYSYVHKFTDLANTVAAWRSATDWDAGQWIRENQGNWLERQMQFQIWTTYPPGWFVKDGDIWSGVHDDSSKARMSIDIVTGMYGSGVGRTWADRIAQRWPKWDGWPSDYHAEWLWEFFLFNNPDVRPEPLAQLGRAAVFSPRLHGYVCWRSSWEDDATIIHFRCGETVDHHASYDQGKFTIFKHAPLAIKNGAYLGYKSPHHMYYKSVWSANNVVFTGAAYDGSQPLIDFDGSRSWAEWKEARDQKIKRPPTGVLLATEANERFARALGDLSGSLPAGSRWTREIVFLGYEHLLVLDRVAAGPGLQHRWTLHTVNEPRVDGALAVADNGKGRLFCRTLLPEGAVLTKVGGPGREFDYNGTNRPYDQAYAKEAAPAMQLGAWRLDVTAAAPAAEEIYLHVLCPTDTAAAAMPEAAVARQGDNLAVKVGGLEYLFVKPRLDAAP